MSSELLTFAVVHKHTAVSYEGQEGFLVHSKFNGMSQDLMVYT